MAEIRREAPARLGYERRGSAVTRFSPAVLLAVCIAFWACAGPEDATPGAAVARLPLPPTGPGAMAPYLIADGEDLLLSWLEPSYRLLVARLHEGSWSVPAVIAEGDDFFANWADVPKVAIAGDGTLWAHWLAKLGEGTYAYGIFLARSEDGGVTWEPRGTLHADRTPTEHGFVAYAPEGDGLRAVWLDGRAMVDDGPMALRTALVGEGTESSEILDSRVCECCPAELAAPSSGAVAFYRDRSLGEVRDIGTTRRTAAGWTEPTLVHEDGWEIAGCPVNGPAADARGDALAVAWFTAGGERSRVQVAFSGDGGAEFSAPALVDGAGPLGRVDLVLTAADEAWVSWLAAAGEGAALRVARVEASGPTEIRTLATTDASRASGIPRLARAGDAVFVAWVESAEDHPSQVRVARLTGS